MANLTSVTLTAGVPTAGTGTVGTIDNVTGTAGVPSVPVLTVQGVASGTPQPVSGTVSANATQTGTWTVQPGNTANTTAWKVDGSAVTQPVSLASVPSHAVTNAGTFATQETGSALTSLQLLDDTITAQGTALGTTKTSLQGGSVTTAAPTYTTGQISPLSLDTSGSLRVNVVTGGGTGGTSSTVGSAAPTVATAVGFTDGNNMALGKVKAASTGAAVATDPAIVVTLRDVNANGGTTAANSAPVVNADQYGQYETVAASQTAQALGATGATGDYLSGVLVFPGTAGCGVVTILDNATTIGTFAGGGTTALPSLVPFMIPVGLFSVSGAWKVTTGANVTAVGIGKFT